MTVAGHFDPGSKSVVLESLGSSERDANMLVCAPSKM